MIESMRAFGYSPATAIADLVDNSITARARLIDGADALGGPRLLGRRSPTTGAAWTRTGCARRCVSAAAARARSARREDLGRFGLGLKTASFSQCRSLTVASRAARRRDGASGGGISTSSPSAATGAC